MRIERVWAMPRKWTFAIKQIKELIDDEMSSGGLYWVDPFAGMFSPAHVRNDLNPDMPAQFHMDALAFLKTRSVAEFDGGFYDPPYSITQAKRSYDNYGSEKLEVSVTNKAYWSRVKDELARVTKLGGKCISCGWNSGGLGKSRGFELTRILLVPHGGNRNDTIVTGETKIQSVIKND